MAAARRGRPAGGENRDKIFRQALRMEIAKGGNDLRKLRRTAAALLKEAEAGNIAAMVVLRDTLDGRPAQAIEHSGTVGTYDLSKVSDAQLDQLESILAPAAIAAGDQDGEGETTH